jgi:hypothetical protein
MLLGAGVCFMFPLFLALEWLCLYAMDTMAPGLLKSEAVDMGVLTAYVGVGGMIGIAGLGLLSALIGLGYAFGRGQPAGLPLGGLVVSLLAIAMSLALLYGTNEGANWTRDFQKTRLNKQRAEHVELVQPQQRQ